MFTPPGPRIRSEYSSADITTAAVLPIFGVDGQLRTLAANERLVFTDIFVSCNTALELDIFNDLTNDGTPGMIGAPANSTATTGGTVAAGTYTLAYTYKFKDGGESPLSGRAAQVTTGATSTITVTAPALPSDCVGICVYLTAGGTTGLVGMSATNVLVLTATPVGTGSLPIFSDNSSGKRLFNALFNTTTGERERSLRVPITGRKGIVPKIKATAAGPVRIQATGYIETVPA